MDVDNLFLTVSLGEHRTPGGGDQRTEEKPRRCKIHTSDRPRANDPTGSSRRSLILLVNSERESTHRMVTCTQISCRAAHPKEHLIVDSPRKSDQSITSSADYLWLSALPRSLEELPVKRTRGHIESAWIDENLTACSRKETVRGRHRRYGSEARKDLFVHQSRPIPGTSRHNICPSQCEQTLSNRR